MPGLETGTIIALSISGGLTIISTALSYFTRPQLPDSEEELNKFDKNITDPNEFISVVYGEARLGINRIFFETWPKNINFLVGVGSICHGEIEGVQKVWFDSDELIAKSNVSGVLEVVKKFDGHVHFETRNGTDDQKVINFVRKETDGWTAKHRGRGIALLAMRLKYNQNKFPTGIPTTTLLAKGQKVRDPRNLVDPPNATQAEWNALSKAWSNNPALCALDYLMSSRYGIGSPASRVDFQSFCDIANYCDTIINTANIIEPPRSCKAELIKSKLELTNNTSYYYKYSFVKESSADYYEEAFESELSPASSVLTLTSLKGRIRLSGIAASPDSTITHRNIYRSTSPTGTYYYIGMLDDNTSTTFIDNISDKDAENRGSHSPTGSGTNPTTAPIWTFTNLEGSLTASKLYRYKITFVNTSGQETEAGDASNRVKTDSEYKAIYLTNIPLSEDTNVSKRKIYRTTGYNATDATPDYKLVYSLDDNTTQSWEDTIADVSLGAVAPSNSTAYTGNFKLYTCNGVVDTSQEVDSNIEEILSSCRGKIYYSGGKYKVSIRRVITPEIIKLNEDNIIGDWEWSTPGFKETCNIVSAEWRNPKENWQYEPFIWPKAGEANQYLIDDNNFENIREIRLPFTTHKKQAKVIAQIIRKESRQQIRCQITVKEEGLNFEYDSLVYITHPLPGWVDKLFWVDEVGILQNGNVRLALTEYDSTSYDLETISKDTPDGNDTTLPDPRLPPSEVTGVTITEELFLDKSVPNWRLKVAYTDPVDVFWYYSNVYVKAGATSNYELYTKINKQSNGFFYIQPIEALGAYYVKIASVSTLMVEQDIEDVTEYVKIVSPPVPDGVLDLEIENRGSDDNVFGNSFKFRWSDISFFAGDQDAKNSYAHQQVNVFNENMKYLVEIYNSGLPDTVRISGQKANERPIRTVLQKINKFEYTVDNGIDDSKRLFRAFENSKTHSYYKSYYGIPQRQIKIVVRALNGWSVISPIASGKIVTNKAPDMLKRDGATLIKPDVEPILNGAEIKFSHPPDEYDINYFMLLVAGDATGSKTQAQIVQAFGATRHKTGIQYSLGDIVYPPDLNGHCYQCSQAGISGNTAPTFTKPSLGVPHPVITETAYVVGGIQSIPVVKWTHYCILRQKKISAQITVDSTEDEIDNASYEIEMKKLDQKKTYYSAVVPYDAWGVGTISDISDSFLPGITEDPSKTQILEPLGGSANIAVTFNLIGSSNGKVSWTKDTATDRNYYVLQWRAVRNVAATIQPTQAEADSGETVVGSYIVISGREIVDVDDNTGNNLNWHTLKDLKNGFKYWGRVRYVNKAQHMGEWSHTDDGVEIWATHSVAISGITDDDFAFRYKKAWYTGTIATTSYRRATWTGLTMKIAKSGGGTTNYSIANGNTGDLATDGTGTRWVVWRSDYLSGTTFEVITDNTLATDVTYKDAVSVAYVIPTSNTDGMITIIPTLGTNKDTIFSSAIIAANSILANHIKVNSLASIVAILGSITAGDLTLAHDGGGFIKFKDSAGRIAIRMRVNSGSNPDLVIMKSGENADNGSDAEDPSKVAFSTKITISSTNIRPVFPKIIGEGLASCAFTDQTTLANNTRSDVIEIQTSAPLNNYFTLNVWISDPSGTLTSTPLEWSDIIYIDSTGTHELRYRAYYYPSTGKITVERKAINTTNVNRATGAITYGARWVLYSDTA